MVSSLPPTVLGPESCGSLDKPYVFRMVEDTNNRWGVWLAGIDEPLVDRGVC